MHANRISMLPKRFAAFGLSSIPASLTASSHLPSCREVGVSRAVLLGVANIRQVCIKQGFNLESNVAESLDRDVTLRRGNKYSGYYG